MLLALKVTAAANRRILSVVVRARCCRCCERFHHCRRYCRAHGPEAALAFLQTSCHCLGAAVPFLRTAAIQKSNKQTSNKDKSQQH
jgi:hypothetical protein